MGHSSKSNEGTSALFTSRGEVEPQAPGASPYQADQFDGEGNVY